MSITYLFFSKAKAGQSEELRRYIETLVLPRIKVSPGNVSCGLLQDIDDPHCFTIVEVWNSLEAHKASIKEIPAQHIHEFMQLVAEPPKGHHFRSLVEL